MTRRILKIIGVSLHLLGLVLVCPPGNDVDAQTTTPTFARAGRLQTSTGANLVSHGVISDPSIMFDNGVYRMWYTAVRNPYTAQQQTGITYADSIDGFVWQPNVDAGGQPLLVIVPTASGWDSGGVETASVVKAPDGTYLMYYSGVRGLSSSNTWALGLATSLDGITWTKFGSSPVMEGGGGWEGPYVDGGQTVGGIAEPSAVYDAAEGLYKMWFSALGTKDGKSAFRMGYATSLDGVVWQRHPTPVLEPGIVGWDNLVISHVHVIIDATRRYHAFYFGTSAAKYRDAEKKHAAMVAGSIGYATSSDGINWTKASSSAPVLNVVAKTWEAWTIGGPAALIEGGNIKLWYFGSATYDTYQANMGLAVAPVPQ